MDSNLQRNYRKSQRNGTIYVSTCLPLSPERLVELESGNEELFLTRISKRCSPEDIMRVALELGDVYTLRFKIDYSGNSRGYAYLQFIERQHYTLALEKLQHHFVKSNLKVIVLKSRNHRSLVLRNLDPLSPLEVYDKLCLISQYLKLCVFEIRPECFVYIVVYRNNEQAASAHQLLRNKMGNFGGSANVEWLDKGKGESTLVENPNCCLQLSRSNNFEQLRRLVESKAPYICFSI